MSECEILCLLGLSSLFSCLPSVQQILWNRCIVGAAHVQATDFQWGAGNEGNSVTRETESHRSTAWRRDVVKDWFRSNCVILSRHNRSDPQVLPDLIGGAINTHYWCQGFVTQFGFSIQLIIFWRCQTLCHTELNAIFVASSIFITKLDIQFTDIL